VGIGLYVLIARTRLGMRIRAGESDREMIGALGVDISSLYTVVFALGAALAGLAGALNAHLTFFIGPNEYGFDRGVEILTMAILGGINGLTGPVLGAVILTLLPEVLRGLRDFRLVVNGLILVVITLFLPRGLWDPMRFRRLLGRKD
jgi:branched-chain amino acid transport system permease protein